MLVIEGVELDLDGIRIGEAGVPPVLGDHDFRRLAVKADDPQVEIVIVEAEPDLRLLGSRRSFVGLLLNKVGGGFHVCPKGLVHQTIQSGRF